MADIDPRSDIAELADLIAMLAPKTPLGDAIKTRAHEVINRMIRHIATDSEVECRCPVRFPNSCPAHGSEVG